jgi:competence protein ComEC
MVDADLCTRKPFVSDLTIQILDVGQGDGIYIEFPEVNGYRCNMLVDLGSTKNKELTKTDVFGYFREHTRFGSKDQEDHRLDWLILTHGDKDHYNMVEDFIDKLKVKIGTVIYGGLSEHYKEDFISILEQKARKVAGAGNKFPYRLTGNFGGAEVHILGANTLVENPNDRADVKNSASVVMQIRFGGNAVMLTGDATFASEKEIMRNVTADQLRSTVLKVAHHGSARTSTQPEWVKAVQPKYVFISSDRSGSLGADVNSTGYRLPQELCIELIRQNTTLAGSAEHTYVSSYDPGDFSDPSKNLFHIANPTKAPIKNVKQWLQSTTSQGIFCTLAKMDTNVPDPVQGVTVQADLGAQYEIRLRGDGSMDICTTLDDGNRSHPAERKKN